MDLQNEKCVMVIDENLPTGIIANTAAILGITLGKKRPYVVGCDVEDQSGGGHLGIGGVLTVQAQSCKTYGEFMGKMAQVSGDELNYFGLAICGAKKKVNKLTGSMPLLR